MCVSSHVNHLIEIEHNKKQSTAILWEFSETDFTQQYQWPEKRKNYVQDEAIASAAAAQKSPNVVSFNTSSPTIIVEQRTPSGSSISIELKNSSRMLSNYRLMSGRRKQPPVYVKLADENKPEEADEDSSTYDSLNEMETGWLELTLS